MLNNNYWKKYVKKALLTTCNFCIGILSEMSVQHSVTQLIADFVWKRIKERKLRKVFLLVSIVFSCEYFMTFLIRFNFYNILGLEANIIISSIYLVAPVLREHSCQTIVFCHDMTERHSNVTAIVRKTLSYQFRNLFAWHQASVCIT